MAKYRDVIDVAPTLTNEQLPFEPRIEKVAKLLSRFYSKRGSQNFYEKCSYVAQVPMTTDE